MANAALLRPAKPVPIRFNFHDQQWLAVESPATEMLVGGSLGGGKSWLCRALSIVYANAIPGLQVFILRRTFGELIDTHWRGPQSFPAMVANLIDAGLCTATSTSLKFWNGSEISGHHFQLESDFVKFQGAEIHMLVIDELTHFSPAQFEALRDRCRLGSLQIPDKLKAKFPFILCSATPGGPYHDFVKREFIDSGDNMVLRQMPASRGGMLRQYIPMRVEKNPSMMANDPGYVERLKGQSDPAAVAAKLHGDWDVVTGSMFCPPWDRAKHVCRPFPIPTAWRISRGCDDGYNAPASVHWITEDPIHGRFFVIAELYERQLLPEQMARLVLERDRSFQRKDAYGNLYPNEDRISGVIDSASYADVGSGVLPRANAMNQLGARWEPSEKYPGSRVHRIQHLHRLLAPASDGWPRLIIFSTCSQLLRALPAAPRSPHNAEDIDPAFSLDHAIDSVTYALSARDRSFKRVRLTGL